MSNTANRQSVRGTGRGPKVSRMPPGFKGTSGWSYHPTKGYRRTKGFEPGPAPKSNKAIAADLQSGLDAFFENMKK